MKKNMHNRKWIKRVVSMITALALLMMDFPPISENKDAEGGIDFDRLAITAHAEAVSNRTKFETVDAEGNTISNLKNMTLTFIDLAEYSRCYAQDSTFATLHKNDTIFINPQAAYGKLESSGDNQFFPLGTNAAPFDGTIRITAIDSINLLLLMDQPLFNVVTDSVAVYKGGTDEIVPLEFIRTNSNKNPLLANEIRPSGNDNAAVWKIVLTSEEISETINGQNVVYGNFNSYGGVIGKMSAGSSISLEFTDNTTTDQGAWVNRATAQGILCGEMEASSTLNARYTNTSGRRITIGGGDNIPSGGLVGKMTGATLNLLDASGLNFEVKAASNAGLLAGYVGANETTSSKITLKNALSFSGKVICSNNLAGGLVGKLEKSDLEIETDENGESSVILTDVEVTGKNQVGGVIGSFLPNVNNACALTKITYNMTNCTIGGNNPGGIIGEYTAVGGEQVNVSKFVFTDTKLISGTAGGVFGIYTANGDTTITGTYNAPEASTHFGGVIGKYTNSVLGRTMLLQNLIVNNVKQTADSKKLGGVILEVDGSSYIKADGVTVGVVGGANKCNLDNLFGGIVSYIGISAEKGSFIDLTGNYKLTTSDDYNGGAVAGSFKNGVLRLAGTTDLSSAKTATGYGQLIYENDTTLVFSNRTGSDSNWTFKRNASATASDLGQWGEVVRVTSSDIVAIDDSTHTVKLLEAVAEVNDKVTVEVNSISTFAKLALNMQLNDGNDHGALVFENKDTLTKTQLLSSEIMVSNEIDLTNTGLLSLMRDGGNGRYLGTNNNFENSPDFFTGSIIGSNDGTAEIKLAVGEIYGCNSNGETLSSDANGGRIYLSYNYGHDAQGLLSFGSGASISNLKISGTMNVYSVGGSEFLYIAPAIGVMTDGASLSNVSISTQIAVHRPEKSKFYIGGVSGVFDGPGEGEDTLEISGGSYKPTINLSGTIGSSHTFTNDNLYVGGILGLLKGADSTSYSVNMTGTEISPKIIIDENVGDTENSFIGGVIGYVRKNSNKERKITFTDVTMTDASVDQKCKYSGGLLGTIWDRTQVKINGLTISGSKVTSKYSADKAQLSGLVYRATGNWTVTELTINNGTTFSVKQSAEQSVQPANFGLIVNEAYEGNDGLYLNLKNSGYSLTNVSLPESTASTYYLDEIAANTAQKKETVVTGGNGTGIININMNNGSETKTLITETGTYQNKVLNNNKLIANQHARYYYNLDVIKKKDMPSDGEKFLIWSIYNYYAPANIKNYGVFSNYEISDLSDVNLSELSYYPVNVADTELPGATFTFGYNAVKNLEAQHGSDAWARYPYASGDMSKVGENERRNQHYLMQNSLFQDVSGKLSTKGTITFAGDFGGIGRAGVLVGGTLTGSLDLKKGITLSGVKPDSNDSPMLINYINGLADDVKPELYLTGLRTEKYPSNETQPIASALICIAEGTGMKLIFSDIKLDARNEGITDNENWTADADADKRMTTAYGTSRSIFKDATLFRTLKSNSFDTIEYYYTWFEDWGIPEGATTPNRNVTYGMEISDTVFYKNEDGVTSGENKYSGNKQLFTNPVNGDNKEFNFRVGFLPYVKNKSKDTTYNISEVKVNFVSTGLVEGCGTYNDPYIISSASLLNKVANYINNENSVLDEIRLPSSENDTWHTSDATYHKANPATNSAETETRYYADNTDPNNITKWTYKKVREYLAGAYYVIQGDMKLNGFSGIGKGDGASEKGYTVFHGVIVGQKNDDGTYPTITNYSSNPFIHISNGSVIKNLNFKICNEGGNDSPIIIEQKLKQDNALYGMNASTGAKYYGGIFGEIVGGDNIIDNVSVTFDTTRPILLRGDHRHLISVGGFAGCILNGGLIFRGKNNISGLEVYLQDKTKDNKLDISGNMDNEEYNQLYVNPYVGRVINGYAVNEGTSDLNNTMKHYMIDKIEVPQKNADKLDVDFVESTINIPNAQALFIMSLITQSTAGTAESPGGSYGVSQSYGINNGVFCGSNHLGDYSQVGTRTAEGGIITEQSDLTTDYNDKAKLDVANATEDLKKSAVPYIIHAYTKEDDSGNNYPARCITTTGTAASSVNTKDKNKFWKITLQENGDFESFANYKSFRGIGSIGLRSDRAYDGGQNDHALSNKYNMKIDTFNGNGNTISLSIQMTRYQRDQENYFHALNTSENTIYTGEWPDTYGIDANTESLLGLGLFDMAWTNGENSYYKDFTLKGYVKDICYNSGGANVTGTNDKTQLFAVGGVVGQGYYGFYQNFEGIYFSGLTIDCSYACGGLIGMNSDTSGKTMTIKKCNSIGNGISVTGGYYGRNNEPRIGIGSFVGMSIGTKVCIDGKDEKNNIAKSDIYISKVSTHYTGTDNRCVVGGLIGYTGQGAVIKNVNIVALDNTAVIGSENVAIVGGIIGLTQRHNDKTRDNTLEFENCSLTNISVEARRCAGGLFGRSWHDTWGPSKISIKNCSIIGDGESSIISASGTNTTEADDIVGGLLGQINTSDGEQSIVGCSVSGYTLKGYNVGGLVGHVRHNGNSNGTGGTNTKSCIIRDTTVSDCSIQAKNYCGGLIGENRIYVAGYNIYTNNVTFSDWDGNDKTSEAGAFIGANADANRQVSLIAVAKYADTVHASKVPKNDIKKNPANNFIVFSDYTGQCLTAGKNTLNISSFGRTAKGGNITDQSQLPYLTINPSSSMGEGEYISGDAAFQIGTNLNGFENFTSGKSSAARIYADWSATENQPNRAYSAVEMSEPYSGAGVPNMGEFFEQTKDSGMFKISTWNTEMGGREGVSDFTLLVVNDANNPQTTTNLIDNYIRLMTGTSNHYIVDEAGKYHIEVTACRYNSETKKFELNSSVTPGLDKSSKKNDRCTTDGKTYTNGYYKMNLTNADSKYDDQFTLIDVQFYDPTDTQTDAKKRIAYHLYVPVLTKKTVNIEFSAASLSGSDYHAQNYINKITSEVNVGKHANNPTTLVDSMDVWTTTYIRYTYPKDQVNELLKLGSDLMWNHDKQVSIYWRLENNIPEDTKMVLIDPNGDVDKAYYSEASNFSVMNSVRTVDFSKFTARANGEGDKFCEQTLYSLLYDKVKPEAKSDGAKGTYKEVPSSTSGALKFKVGGVDKYYLFDTVNGDIDLVVEEDLNEDYYLSLYVPKTPGQADVVQFQPAGMASAVKPGNTPAMGNVIRATVTSKLNAVLIVGDFYEHHVTSYSLRSAQNSQIITEANKVLTATSTASISLIDNEEHTQAAYFANYLKDSSLYHSFNLQMIRNDTPSSNTDIIMGIEQNNITATYSINGGEQQVISGEDIIRESSYIQCTTGDIISYLVNPSTGYSLTITGTAVLDFSDYSEEFPPNPSEAENIGVRGAVRSNIAFHKNDLPYSKMNAQFGPVSPYYYTKDDNSALFSFDAIDELDQEEIGTNTKNNSRLGVNDHFVYNNQIRGKSVYNALDVKDYEKAKSIEYTLELYRKTTENGETSYKQVNLPDYLSPFELKDSEKPTDGFTTEEKTKEVDGQTVKYYVYKRDLDHTGIDKDAIFYTDFVCTVLKGELSKREYANYKIQLTVHLNGSANSERTSYIVYTNAKIDPTMIEEEVQ